MMKIWPFTRKGASGYSAASNAKQVTHGIYANDLTAIVTGATNGIGAETTRTLALRGVYVVMAVRNVNAGKNRKQKILEENPAAKIDVMELDLSSLASVEKFANEFKASGLPLNILINNAGIMGIPYQLSKDKIELHFATNYLGHFYLTYLLLDIMKKTVHESKKEGRIVNVTSEAHRLTYSEGIRFERINDESGYISFQAYGQSKLANILHANELARRMKEEGVSITANSVHPGNVTTNILHHRSFLNGVMHGTIGKLLLKDVEQGAATSCYVALHPQVEGVTGKYFMNSNIARPSYQAEDIVLAKQLWDFSLKLTQG